MAWRGAAGPVSGAKVEVAIAADLGDRALARLRAVSPRVRLHPPGRPLRGADVVLGGERLDPGQLPLRWWQLSCTGVEHLEGAEMPPLVTNASGVEAAPIAEYVLAALLDHAQRGGSRRVAQQRREWTESYARLYGSPLRGATLVIAGYGAIGREVARLAAAFGMRILACKARPRLRQHDGFRQPGCGDPEGRLPERLIGIEQLPEFVALADYLVLALPDTAATRGLLGAELLGRMRPDALLVNVGRGAVVDERSLAAALRGGRLGGAVLDVVAAEPLAPESELWSVPGLTITPHVAGGASQEAQVDLFVENLRRFVAGEPLVNQVELSRGY